MGKFNNKKVYRVDPTISNGAINNTVNDDDNMIGVIEKDEIGKTLYNQTLTILQTEGSDPTLIFELMNNPDPNERDIAFRTLSELILEQQDRFVSLILTNSSYLKLIISHCVDSDVQTRVSAIGSLRNLAIVEPKSIEQLLSNDLLAPLLKNVDGALTNIINLKPNEIKSNQSLESQHTLIQSIALVTLLIEESDKAFQYVGSQLNMNHIKQLFKLLNGNQVLIDELTYHIAEFMTVITEDNAALANAIGQSELMQLYQTVSQSTTMSLRLKSMVSTTLLNIGSHFQTKDKVVEALTPILLSSLTQFNPVTSLAAISTIIDNGNIQRELLEKKESEEEDDHDMKQSNGNDNEDGEEIEETEVTMDTNTNQNNSNGNKNNSGGKSKNVLLKEIENAEKQLTKLEEQWKDSILAQQSSIEIFTNILSRDASDVSASANNTYDDDDKFLDVEDIQPGSNTSTTDSDTTPLINYLSTTNLLQSLIDLIQLLESQDMSAFVKKYNTLLPLVVMLRQVYQRSITCLANLLISFKPETIHSQDKIFAMMVKIASQSIHNGELSQSKIEQEQMEMATGSLWSLLRMNKNLGFNSIEEIKNLLMITMKAPTGIKTNLVGMVGILGQKQMCFPVLGDIGKLLIFCLQQDQSAEVISETLNSIFDVFAEPPVNDICRELNMIQTLEQYVPFIRNKIKVERKSMDIALLDRLDESRINLIRFIKYKKAQK